jgi:cell division septation protein DedD
MITRKTRTTKKETKKFVFQLGLSGFLSLGVLIVIGMAWSFILGVIVGRGYQPEKMALEAAQQILPEDFPLLTEKNEEVLKAEELEFFDKLKQDPAQSAAPESKPAPAKPAPEPAKTQDAATAKKQDLLKPTTAKPAEKPAPAVPADLTASKEEVFVFNYQVAALASMEQAQTILKQIAPGGFKTSVVTATHEGKTWYRVYVHHQGTVDSAKTLKDKLKANGINSILLRSRTPL